MTALGDPARGGGGGGGGGVFRRGLRGTHSQEAAAASDSTILAGGDHQENALLVTLLLGWVPFLDQFITQSERVVLKLQLPDRGSLQSVACPALQTICSAPQPGCDWHLSNMQVC